MQIMNTSGAAQIVMLSPNTPSSSQLVIPELNYYNVPKILAVESGVQVVYNSVPGCAEYDHGVANGWLNPGSVESC